MSVNLERLRMLRRQSGTSSPSLSHSEGEGRGGVPLASPRRDAATHAKAPLPNPPLPHAEREGAKSVGPTQVPVFSGSVSPPQNLASLRKLLGLRERGPASIPAHRTDHDRSLPGEEIAPGLRLIESRIPHAAPAAALPLAFARRDDAADPRDLLFFDTETTGLAGGTGTRAFMIGAADWHDGALRVRQLLITTMAAETAMLRAFAGWLSPRTMLSSYNGRCYDSPLLKTRYRLARLPEPLSALDHVDLLFPTRRRYRGIWENCRLATIERQLLRIVREDDLPGAEAPAAWLHYLRGGSARNLRRVADHNHQDVVTLALLMQRLVQAEAEEQETLPMLAG